MSKVTLNNITGGYAAVDLLNENFDAIEAAFENTLSRNGAVPNPMLADFDLNHKDILNGGQINTQLLVLNGQPVTPGTLNYNGVVKETQTSTSGQTVFDLTTITYSPLVNNLSVYVDGVYQNPSRYTETSATRVTFSEGLHLGAVVDFVVMSLNELSGTTDAANVTYQPAGSGAVATLVSTKLQETVSVKDFGAVGDGVTDDTDAIDNAIAALPNGSTIYFPAGTYKTSRTIYMGTSGVNYQSLIGINGAATIECTDNSVDILYLDSVAALTFENINFKHTTKGVGNGININSTQPNITYSFKNAFKNVSVSNCNHGIYAINSYWNTFDGVQLADNTTGMYLYGGTSWTVNNCAAYRNNTGYVFRDLNYSSVNVIEASDTTVGGGGRPLIVQGCNNLSITALGIERATIEQYDGAIIVNAGANVTFTECFINAVQGNSAPAYAFKIIDNSNVVMTGCQVGVLDTDVVPINITSGSTLIINTLLTNATGDSIFESGSNVTWNGVAKQVTHNFGATTTTWLPTVQDTFANSIKVTNSSGSASVIFLSYIEPGVQYTFYNGTSHTIGFKQGYAGTQINVTSGKYAIVISDGTNFAQIYQQP